jgi:hypothetical protein
MPWYELIFYIFLAFGGASMIGLFILGIIRIAVGWISPIAERVTSPVKKLWNHWF